jgi:hypothetical protein
MKNILLMIIMMFAVTVSVYAEDGMIVRDADGLVHVMKQKTLPLTSVEMEAYQNPGKEIPVNMTLK